MTVTTTANSILYAGNGTTTAFAFPYIFFAPTDLVVTLVTASIIVEPPPVLNGGATYDYTLAGDFENGEYASGATITFNTAPPGGTTVSIVRAVPAIQTVTLIDNTKFPADTINTEFDYLTVLAQQTSAVTTVALHIPDSEVGLNVRAATAATRANKILAWDAAGNLTHSTKDLDQLDDIDVDYFDARYVDITGDAMSGPLSVPFLTTTNATVNTSLQVMPGGTANVPTPGANDVSTKAATTAWVVGFLGAQGQGEAVYKFGGSVAGGDPGTGNIVIDPGVGIERVITMSRLDADGVARFLTAMGAGDAMVVTNELTPVTAYARYTLTSDVTDNGTWVQFSAHLNDSSNPLEAPPLNTRLRVTGFLNTMSGGAAISGVSAGYGLTGGGSSGVIPMAIDTTVVAELTDLNAYLLKTGGTLTGALTGTSATMSGTVTTPVVSGGAATLVLNAPTGQRISQRVNNVSIIETQNNAMYPGTTNTIALGATTNRWSTVASVLGDFTGALTGTTATLSAAIPAGSNDTTVPTTAWVKANASGSGAATHVGVSPPPVPIDGQLWFYTDASIGGGALYVRYNDTFGSPQWVPASPGLGTGSVVQTVSYQTGAVATGTTVIPLDDTIPQITEGNEYMTLSVTPRSATSKLLITVSCNVSSSTAGMAICGALFQDSTANALAVTYIYSPTATVAGQLTFHHTMTSGTTSATTFRVRIGSNGAGTTTFNGSSGVRQYGGVMASSIVIQEVL